MYLHVIEGKLHQLNTTAARHAWAKGLVTARCMCGETFADGQLITSKQAKQGYISHVEKVKG